MKIAHVCVSCFYVDGGGYQENKLVQEHVKEGHDVKVFASTENHDSKGRLTWGFEDNYLGDDGAKVNRLSYIRWLPTRVSAKLRAVRGLRNELKQFSPDLIMFHGLTSWELFTMRAYKKINPCCSFVIDSHEDFNNSARNLFSYFLHRYYYRPIIRLNLKIFEKIFYISLETKDFIQKIYGVDGNKLEYLPLGGNIRPSNEIEAIRTNVRDEHKVGKEHIVFLQSGKFNERKKLKTSLQSFIMCDNPDFRFWIAGVMTENISKELISLIESDDRVNFFGWVSTERLEELLISCDVYLQPGTQSVTMQAALCAGRAVAIDNVKSHKPYINGNGWLLDSQKCLDEVFKEISNDCDVVLEMGKLSMRYAKENLDYKKLANQVLIRAESDTKNYTS